MSFNKLGARHHRPRMAGPLTITFQHGNPGRPPGLGGWRMRGWGDDSAAEGATAKPNLWGIVEQGLGVLDNVTSGSGGSSGSSSSSSGGYNPWAAASQAAQDAATSGGYTPPVTTVPVTTTTDTSWLLYAGLALAAGGALFFALRK